MNGGDVPDWTDLYARAAEAGEGAGGGIDEEDVRAALSTCRDER